MADSDERDKSQSFNEERSIYHYMENGLIVFTEAYHLRRGHCCKSGCRHCPYGFRKKQEKKD
jgi:hypothetical protein